MSLTIEALTGESIISALPAVARLRIEIFREFPYLYEGTIDYEERYLEALARADRAVVVAARDVEAIVGAATAMPLRDEHEAFRRPFEEKGYDLGSIFYFAESVLKPEYRGGGLGHAFFDVREAHARSFGGYTHAAFCGVVRPDGHPLRPPHYRPLDRFWRKRGYEAVPGLVAFYSWTDIGEAQESEKPMQFWMRRI